MKPAAENSRGDAQPGVRLDPRRGFVAKSVALLASAAAYGVPAIAAAVAMLNPLRQKGQAGQYLQVATLDTLPEDGSPRKFPVIMDRSDAWNRFAREPVGAVMLRRMGGGKVQALQIVCPHAGCFVEYVPGKNALLCPCHNGSFDLSGKRLDSTSPSPRDLDALEAQVRNGNEVWVKFQNFRTGIPQKIADA